MTILQKLKTVAVRIRDGVGYGVDDKTMLRVYEPVPGVPNCLVSAQQLAVALKNAGENPSFELTDKSLRVSGGKFRTLIPLSDFEPLEPTVQYYATFSADIHERLRLAALGITRGDNGGRPFLDFIHVFPGVAFGSNGKMMSFVDVPEARCEFELMPTDIPEGVVEYRIADSCVSMQSGGVRIISPRPAERPVSLGSIKKLIPTQFVHSLEVSREELKNALSTCDLIVTIASSGLVVSVSSNDGRFVNWEIEAVASGQFSYRFNGIYLRAMLSAFDSEKVKIQFSDIGAAYIESGAVKFVVMGIR